MDAYSVIILARKHLGVLGKTEMQPPYSQWVAARQHLDAASKSYADGIHLNIVKSHALKSLKISAGARHPDYRKASKKAQM